MGRRITVLLLSCSQQSDHKNRPYHEVEIRAHGHAILALEAVDIKSICAKEAVAMPGTGAFTKIAMVTLERVRARLDLAGADAVRFGVFSYVVEAIRLLKGENERIRACAVEIANAFLGANASVGGWWITMEDLAALAERVQTNEYGWEGFCIAYIDPEASRLDRLRQNLRLTPSERWHRHRKLISQLSRVRRA